MPQPIHVYVIPSGPNPWKVIIILEELQLPYEITLISHDDCIKNRESHIRVNPNFRVPAIHDPNTGITLWESGAIVEYLVDTYDTQEKISYRSDLAQKYRLRQWLHFQTSGQGTCFGQAAWFNLLHPEPLPSAQTRYESEVKRILSVLDKALQGRDYLVGNKCTYADLAFFMWNYNMEFIFKNRPEAAAWTRGRKDGAGDGVRGAGAEGGNGGGGDGCGEGLQNFRAWHERLAQRGSVRAALRVMGECVYV